MQIAKMSYEREVKEQSLFAVIGLSALFEHNSLLHFERGTFGLFFFVVCGGGAAKKKKRKQK